MAERPSPDQLLAKYQQTSRGKLTLFLGAAAGVGKTYAMLKALPELMSDGIDVVIGYIEPHQRAETAALILPTMEIIPPRVIEYRGHQLHEVDIDAILARKPQLVVIDELAHSNVPTSRNLKRYQDVLELLAAGIDVYSAVNIQHIESLNDVVAQITGVTVNETIPDYIIDQASEVKLIDITPDELIERLKDGKIYPPERAVKALDNFFRKGNLTALREMALLKTARKVEQQVKEYRADKDINAIWSSHDRLMVVIEPGYSSEKVVRSAKAMADKGFSGWYVIYLDNSELSGRPLRDRERLLELLNLAQELGAAVTQLNSSNPAEAIIDFAREHNVNTVVLSQYRLSLYYRLFGTSLVAKLTELAPELSVHLIRDESLKNRTSINQPPIKKALNWSKLARKLLINTALFTLLGAVLLPLGNWLSSGNILMIYLLAIVGFNYGRGKLSALVAALMATISYDFFFIPPRFSFAIGDIQYIITFIIMAVVAIAFNVINGNLRYQVGMLRKTQAQMTLLYASSRKLAEAMVEAQVVEVINDYLPSLFQSKFVLLLPTLEEKLVNYSSATDLNYDLSIASWVFDNGKIAGCNTDTFAGSPYYYVAVNTPVRTRGVVVLAPENPLEFFLPANQQLLANFIGNLATTLERIHFTQIAIQTEILLANHKSS